MFKKLLIILFIVMIVPAGKSFSQGVQLQSHLDSLAYSIGYNFGFSLKRDSLYLDLDIIRKAMEDVLAEKQPLLNQQQMSALLQSHVDKMKAKQAEMQQKMEEERKMMGEENRRKGREFLEANKQREGVNVTPTGLQYEVLKEGEGASPTANDVVKVHYKGTLINGEVFDSSYDRGKPIEFNLSGVIKGWTEGVQLMKEGGKYKFYIPSELAYGARGAGQAIGPDETLIFEVELLEIVKKEQKQ